MDNDGLWVAIKGIASVVFIVAIIVAAIIIDAHDDSNCEKAGGHPHTTYGYSTGGHVTSMKQCLTPDGRVLVNP